MCEQERKQTISTQHALAGYRLQNTATHSSFNTSPICFMDMPMELPTAVQSILTRQKEAGRCFVFVYMETGQVLASTRGLLTACHVSTTCLWKRKGKGLKITRRSSTCQSKTSMCYSMLFDNSVNNPSPVRPVCIERPARLISDLTWL